MNVFLGMPNMTSPPIKAITKHLRKYNNELYHLEVKLQCHLLQLRGA